MAPSSAVGHIRGLTSTPAAMVLYERALERAIPATARRAILAEDEFVTVDTSPVQLVRVQRDSVET
ncbi:MAG: hypothetical protein ACRDWV_02470 [Acidimicrobiales bacterium]